jgi:hypothetical protein
MYHVGSVSRDSENDGGANCRANNGANGPEKRQAVQHLTEGLAGLIPEVQSLAELSATRSVDSADILNVCIDTRA